MCFLQYFLFSYSYSGWHIGQINTRKAHFENPICLKVTKMSGTGRCPAQETLCISPHSNSQQTTKAISCGNCQELLSEPNEIADDNNDARLGCKCKCQCKIWWELSIYDQHLSDQNCEWICPSCNDSCNES